MDLVDPEVGEIIGRQTAPSAAAYKNAEKQRRAGDD
jgi:hypothetical protein